MLLGESAALLAVGLSAIGLGSPLLARLAPQFRGDALTRMGLSGMAGVALAALVATLVNFVAPVGTGVAIAIFAAGIVLFALGPARSLTPFSWAVFGVLIVACAQLTGWLHGGPDGGLYHLPNQNWIVSEKVGIGMANLYGRLGFGSIYEPLLSLGWLGGPGLWLVPVVVALIPLFFLLTLAGAIRDAKGDAFLLYAATMLSVAFLWIYGTVWVRTGWVNNDAPSALVALLCVYCGLRAATDDEDHGFLTLSFLFAVFAGTLKLSAAAVGLFPVGLAVYSVARGRGLPWGGLGLCILLFLPWVARNIVVSGCLAFPYRASCLPVSWAARAAGDREADWVLVWGRAPDTGFDHLTGWGWIPLWYERVRWFLFSLVGLAVFGGLVAGALGSSAGVTGPRRLAVLLLAAYAAIATALWFVAGPAPRFGVAPLFVLVMLPGIWLLAAGGGKTWPWSPAFVAAGVLCLSVIAAFAYSYLRGPYFDAPVAYMASDIPTVETVIDGDVRRPEGETCFLTPLPCSPYGQSKEVRIGSYRAYFPIEPAVTP